MGANERLYLGMRKRPLYLPTKTALTYTQDKIRKYQRDEIVLKNLLKKAKIAEDRRIKSLDDEQLEESIEKYKAGLKPLQDEKKRRYRK